MNENKQWPLMVNALSAVMCFAMCGCATTSRDWKDAKCSGTSVAYEQFLERHFDAREAKAKNTDDGWIESVQQHIECKEVVDAAAQLQTHALYTQGYVIPWRERRC